MATLQDSFINLGNAVADGLATIVTAKTAAEVNRTMATTVQTPQQTADYSAFNMGAGGQNWMLYAGLGLAALAAVYVLVKK